MLEFYDRMVDEKVFPQVEYYDRLNLENRTYGGTVAWVSDAANYCSSTIEKGDEVVAAPYTHTADTQSGEGWYAKPATLYAISRNTDHPEEAAMLLDFLLNDKSMAVLQGVEKGVPLSHSAREALLEVDMLQGIQYEASLCMEENQNMGKMNSFVEDGTLIDMFIASCNLVLFDKMTPEEAAQDLYRQIKETYQ